MLLSAKLVRFLPAADRVLETLQLRLIGPPDDSKYNACAPIAGHYRNPCRLSTGRHAHSDTCNTC